MSVTRGLREVIECATLDARPPRAPTLPVRRMEEELHGEPREVPERDTVSVVCLRALKAAGMERATAADVAMRAGITVHSAREALSRLHRLGLVVRKEELDHGLVVGGRRGRGALRIVWSAA